MANTVESHQHTLRKPVSFGGIGLHSGDLVNMTISPAPENNGIRFFRRGQGRKHFVQAAMDNVIDTRLATTISDTHKNIVVSTTEHLMAALLGFGIDNADIELDGNEVPIMDGSAGPFIQRLMQTGRQKQKANRTVLRITKEIIYSSGESSIRIRPFNGFKIDGEIVFDDEIIRTQRYAINLTGDRFAKEIAQARTFGYVEEVETLWEKGLALGVNLSNAIAIHWDKKSVLNEEGLRFSDEFIRHKVLDLVGDLALLGCPILGHVTACCTGHTQHLAFMQTIAKATDCWELVEMNPNGKSSPCQKNGMTTASTSDLLMPFFKTALSQPAPVPAC